MHKQGKTRSKTGCRTCRIRKIKCDEEKQQVQGQAEPQCRRCAAAQIKCEWKGGPIPRKSIGTSTSTGSNKDSDRLSNHGRNISSDQVVRKRSGGQSPIGTFNALLLPARISSGASDGSIQAANSLTLSPFDRDCLSYLESSTLVVMLGKHWPWSAMSYAYRKIAVNEPMVMSMILASTAQEIHRSRLYDQKVLSGNCERVDSCELDGRMHYGRALSSLRHALKQNANPIQKIEAIFITLWLMIDYENRFGSGATAINIHIKGIESLLQNKIVPLLQNRYSPAEHQIPLASHPSPKTFHSEVDQQLQISRQPDKPGKKQVTKDSAVFATESDDTFEGLRRTSVPLFLLWTLYFFTPGALFFAPTTGRLDTDIYQSFLTETADVDSTISITLPELYRISRQSPARFWGDEYPMSARLDDMENLPSLTLYHRSHVVQFKITELFKQGTASVSIPSDHSPYQQIIDEIYTISVEYDTVLGSAKSSTTCESIGDGRRVMETIHWATITFYSTIVFFHLCFQDVLNNRPETQVRNTLIPLQTAVSHVLELSLQLHRSRPRLMVRITWPLFLAGIATSDQIYQDWVSIRLRELGRYGQNFSRISRRFDEIIRGSPPYAYDRDGFF
ncbi:hypothetical protein N7462_000517 [Penicillium macrosclerotiorum]|uniref:uncharacterized protein n=1 Tax=Penicillium macrosclerotiorum TaxID=303699 RepID=UPI002548F9B0|nr:uncharacterized protein N7462_000517 [Penicillium macrosclerotiorum]KAJ5698512.1 hypothetical protein N7462_000517 [Penicillium macrosclerotiorum]